MVITDVKECPRCGENHSNVPFHKFGNGISGVIEGEDLFDHWALCPTRLEPLLSQGIGEPE